MECQQKLHLVTEGRAETIHTEEGNEGPIAENRIKEEYRILFYDLDTTNHRNSYSIIITPEEADTFTIGKIYTLTID